MKRVYVFIVSLWTSYPLWAQQNIPDPFQDSSRFIELREVRITGQTKNTQQKLVNFYKANPSFSLEDILARLPEISLIRRGPYGMEPSVRNFTGGQINVLIDGMRIYGACTDKMDPPTIYIEPVNLKTVQVKTGQNGFLHGSSVGGTVLLNSTDPEVSAPGQLKGKISSGYNSVSNGFYESARLQYRSGKWYFQTNGTFRKNDFYRDGNGQTVPYSGMTKANYGFTAKYLLHETFSVKADFIGDDGWNIGYPALPMDVGYAAARIGSLSVSSEKGRNNWENWTARVYYNQIRHYMDDTHRPESDMHMDMPGFSRTFGAFAEASYKISAKQGLKLRSDFSATDLTASMTMYQQGSPPMYMLTWPDHRKTQSGISAAWRIRPDSAWKIEVNARADWIRHRLTTDAAKEEIEILGYPTAGRDDFGKNLSASVNKMISGHASLSFSMAYSERIPSSSELYGFYLFNAQDGYDYIGKADLKPEQAVQAELSSGIHSHRFQIRLTAYAVLLNNYITGIVQPGFIPMTSGANGVKSYLNLPFAQLLGGEGSINWQPVKTVQAIGTLKYTYASDDHQMPLPFIAPLKSVISLRWQPGAFSAQAECEASAAQNRFSISAGEDGTPGYMLLHLRLGYSLPIRSTMIGVQAGIENVFDRYYHDHLDWNNIPRPGRNIYLQASIGF